MCEISAADAGIVRQVYAALTTESPQPRDMAHADDMTKALRQPLPNLYDQDMTLREGPLGAELPGATSPPPDGDGPCANRCRCRALLGG